MGTFTFKSSGVTQDQQIVNSLLASPVPIGITTPLRFGSAEGIFAMSYNLADQVHDNLRNLILTNWGERLGFYDFGANLRELTTDFAAQDDFDSQAIQRIGSAVAKWMPFVNLESFISEIDRTEQHKHTATVKLTVTYNIPALGVTKRALQVILYVL